MHNGNELKGFQRLQEYISKKSQITNASILSGQKAAAEYLQDSMRGRSAPRGRSSPHMLDTFMFEQDETTAETKFGWSRFYGRMVESGHKVRPPGKRKKKAGEQRTVKAQPHLKPEFDKNQDQLVKIMIETMKRGVNNGDCQF